MNTHNALYYITAISQKLNPYYDDLHLCQQYAWWLLQKLCTTTKTTLITQPSVVLNEKQEETLTEWITDLTIHKKPIQYILGSVPFNDIEILVEPPILIPRPETEEWCYNLIKQLKRLKNRHLTLLDLATGSGCIALALANHLPEACIIASDIAENALALAAKNASHNKISNISFIKSDLFDELSSLQQYDIIVSNPPYIAHSERASMDESVLQWEDEDALFASDEGLSLIKTIITQAPFYIKPNSEMRNERIPQLIIEIGWLQGHTVKQLMLDAGYNDVYIHKDLEKKDRIATGRVDNVANTHY